MLNADNHDDTQVTIITHNEQEMIHAENLLFVRSQATPQFN